jgi:uncharacterized protein (TIGR00725 family)
MAAPQIAVCGDGSPNTPHAAIAAEVGRLLAEAGAVVLTGGMDGVMLAASEAALAAGGVAVAVLPSGSPAEGLAPATARVATGMGEARNAVLVRSAGAVIAIGGGFGTLSEIALARRLGRPVFGLATWEAEPPGGGEPLVRACADADEAVRLAIAAAS